MSEHIGKIIADENKFRAMTQQLRITHSDEQVAEYLRFIIKSDTAKEYWIAVIKANPKLLTDL